MPDSDPDEDEDPLGTGNYWVTVRLEKPIPQFLPMQGRKIEIYYRAMEQMCVNCYGSGHKKKDCTNPKKEWMDYVIDFIEGNSFKPEMYGKWHDIAMRQYKRKQAGESTNTKTNVEKQPGGLEVYGRTGATANVLESGASQDGNKTKQTEREAEPEKRTGWSKPQAGTMRQGRSHSFSGSQSGMQENMAAEEVGAQEANSTWTGHMQVMDFKKASEKQTYRNTAVYKKNTQQEN